MHADPLSTQLPPRRESRRGCLPSAFIVTTVAVWAVSFTALRPVAGATISDILFLAAGITVVVGSIQRRRDLGLPGWLTAASAMLALAGVAALLSPPRGPSEAAFLFPKGGTELSGVGALARLLFALLLVPLVVAHVSTTASRVRCIVNAWLLGAGLSALVGVLAYFGIIESDTFLNDTESVVRVHGLAIDSNSFAAVAAISLPLATLLTGFESGPRRFAYAALAALLCTAILLSGSRAGILGAVTGLAIVVAFSTSGRRGFRSLVLAFAIAVLVVGVTQISSVPALDRLLAGTDTVGGDARRAAFLGATIDEALTRPIVGFGLEYIRGAHNIYLQVFHAAGIVGLLGLGFLIAGLLSTGGRLARAPVLSDFQRVVAFGCLVGLLVWLGPIGLLQPAIFDRFLFVPVGLLVALARLVPVGTHTGPERVG